jgi:hypothetical protein
VSSAKRKTSPAESPTNDDALSSLKAELQATDLLALNATIRSAQDGVNGEELFAALREIRNHARRSLEHLARHESRASN